MGYKNQDNTATIAGIFYDKQRADEIRSSLTEKGISQFCLAFETDKVSEFRL